jgi:hypothetical protein
MDKYYLNDYTEGLEIAIVIDIEDPEGGRKIRVRRPDFGDMETGWISTTAFVPGLRPATGDRVKIGYLGNNPDEMFALIGDWSDLPLESMSDELREAILNKNKPGKDNPKYITSESGYSVIADDSGDMEKMRIITPDGKIYDVAVDGPNLSVKTNNDISGLPMRLSARGKITLRDKDNTIEISKGDSNGNVDVKIEGKNKDIKKGVKTNDESLH